MATLSFRVPKVFEPGFIATVLVAYLAGIWHRMLESNGLDGAHTVRQKICAYGLAQFFGFFVIFRQ